jgi:hypothetical protein
MEFEECNIGTIGKGGKGGISFNSYKSEGR